MNNLEVVIGKRYATKKNLAEINRIAPDAKITIYNIQKRHPIISKIRGGLRRILPFSAYALFSTNLNEHSDKQKLIWLDSPAKFPDKKTALLFSPNIELSVAEELISRLQPSWIHSIMSGIDRLPTIPEKTMVTNSRGIHSERIAEFVMSLIFALAKNLSEHIDQTKRRIWKMLPSKMIKGAEIGIVGLGSIGTEIAKIAKINGMKVWAIKRKVTPHNFVDCLLPPEQLPELLREVDYVVLAVPLTRETYHLIGKAELDIMKSTASLINICRGAVIDENALYYALKNNRISGACIDVFKGEKALPKNSRFYKMQNIVITSFSAWHSENSDKQRMDLFFQDLERFICGEPLLNLVDNSQLRYR